jgi:hypothetical protein
VNDIDQLVNINLKMYADAKKKPEYTKSFADTIREIEKELEEDLIKQKEEIKPEEEEDGLEELEKEQENDEKKPAPLYVELQVRCLNLCQHLISHPYRQIRLLIVDVVREICFNLADNQNELLPLVHKLWSPICKRFGMDDLVMKSKIMLLLFDLSIFCTDFLASRFSKEFLPHLGQFMFEQAKQSLKYLSDSTYIYSQAHKLQCAILNNLDKMCVLFEIKELELEIFIVNSLLPYLDHRQPKRLQQLALTSLRSFSYIDSDVVWICLHYATANNNRSSQIKSNNNGSRLSNNITQQLQLSTDTLNQLTDLINQL